MFTFLVSASLRNRLLVLAMAAILVLLGAYTARQLPVDVFPDPTGPSDPPERHAGAMARAVARQLDTMARETEADRG